MFSFHKNESRIRWFFFLALATISGAICAQDTSTTNSQQVGKIDVVIVTAQKISQDIQKTAAAVTAVSGDELGQAGVTELGALSKFVPDLVMATSGQNVQIFLRGVGQSSFTDNTSPAVAYNVDGIYTPLQVGRAGFFDVERVEVLPGPAGTLWGRNAAGGVINVISRQPGDDFGGEAALEAGNYALQHFSGAVNLPVSDTVKVRAAFDSNRRDGYLTDGANDADSQAGRLSVLFKPTEKFSVLARISNFHNGGIGDSSVWLAPRESNNPWAKTYPSRGKTVTLPFGSNCALNIAGCPFTTTALFNDSKGTAGSAEFNYQFDGATLTYIPSLLHYAVDSAQNLDNAPTESGSIVNRNRGDVYSQELRLASSESARGKWVTGLYWYKAKLAEQLDGTGAPTDPCFVCGIANLHVEFNTEQETSAVFGEYTFAVTDRLRLTVGGRYSHDRESGGGSKIITLQPGYLLPFPITIPLGGFAGTLSTSQSDWKIGIEADVAKNSLAYASVQTGYTAGGYNQCAFEPCASHTFDPEKVTAFTVGTKNSFLEGRLQVNDELYYYDYKDYQLIDSRTGSVGTLNYVNAPAIIYGNQLNINYLLTENTRLDVGLGLNSAKIGDFLLEGALATIDLSGFQLPNSSHATATAGLQQTWPLASGAKIIGDLTARFNSGYWADLYHSPGTHQDAYTTADINLTYNASDARWSAGMWGRNITNTAYYSTISAIAPGYVTASVSDPRTFGVRLTVHY